MKDKQLIALAAKAAQGDKKAFEELYAEHVRSILFHVRSLIVDKDNCYDVAQDAVLQMFTHIHQLREPAAFRGWMHQIIRTTCAEHNRKLLSAAKQVDTDEAEEQLEGIEDNDAQVDPEAATMAKLEGNHLFAIVNELPQQYAEILAQRYYDDLSYKEISEILGISMSNVGMRLQRATEALRKKIGEMGQGHVAQYEGTAMRDDATQGHKNDIPADTGVDVDNSTIESAAKGAIKPNDEEALRNSFMSGVAMLFPKDPVDEFLTTTNEKLVEVAGAAGTTGGAAAASHSLWSVVAGVGGTALIVTMFAVGVVTLGPAAQNEQASEGVIAPQEEVQLYDYAGTMRLDFIDADGNGSDRNVVSAQLVEDEATAELITWELYRVAEGATLEAEDSGEASATPEMSNLLFSGSGNEVGTQIFGALEQGDYLLVYTLVDENNATAVVKRNFVITE